jgi:hypothetical protein
LVSTDRDSNQWFTMLKANTFIIAVKQTIKHVCPFILLLLGIVFSVLRFADSDYPVVFFKLFLLLFVTWCTERHLCCLHCDECEQNNYQNRCVIVVLLLKTGNRIRSVGSTMHPAKTEPWINKTLCKKIIVKSICISQTHATMYLFRTQK